MTTRCVSLLTVACGFAAVGFCQVDRATLTGTLHDPSGAVIARAKISVIYAATGFSRAVTSNDTGAYFMPGLPLGDASVEVQAAGFRTARSAVALKVGETRTIDYDL